MGGRLELALECSVHEKLLSNGLQVPLGVCCLVPRDHKALTQQDLAYKVTATHPCERPSKDNADGLAQL